MLTGVIGTTGDLQCNIHPSLINCSLKLMAATGYCHAVEVRQVDSVPSPLPTMTKAVDAVRITGMSGFAVGRSLKERILPELDQLEQVRPPLSSPKPNSSCAGRFTTMDSTPFRRLQEPLSPDP